MQNYKQIDQERLQEITEGIQQDIQELFESDIYLLYLSVMSRFHCNSVIQRKRIPGLSLR